MKNLTPAMKAHIREGVTTICTCIEFIRRDGESFRFTDLDRPVVVANGTYTPYASFARSSISTSLELEVDQMEIQGILNSAYVSRESVAAGLFDYADVNVFAVNYNAPDSGKVILRVGKLGEVVLSEDGTFKAELRGLTQALAYRIGEAYSPECRAELGDKRCKLALAPPRWTPDTPYSVGSSVIGVLNPATSYRNLSFVNGGFDDDGFVNLARDLTGWTSYGAARGRWTCRQDDFHGGVGHDSYAAYGTDDGNSVFDDHGNPQHTVANIGMYQDIDLVAQSVPEATLDTGLCRLYSTIWMITVTKYGGTRYRVMALDANRVQIGANALYDTGIVSTAEDRWFQYTAQDVLIPTGTRYLRFDLYSQKKSSYEEGAGFDTIYAAINDPNGTLGSSDQSGDVAFIALNAGTSGTTEPAWSNVLGDTFTDGTITWKCVKAWKKTTYVDHTGASTAVIYPEYVFDADGYYDGGLARWETGRNAGKAQEIKTWAGGALTLFERPFYPPQPGDRLVIFPGCDRMRSTCVAKFSNILNFRAEPDVPGQDKYYNTPNSSS